MEIGINGGVSLQITDRISGEVMTVDCHNLVTNYGLQRLFTPKNLRDKCATHFCFGYRTTDPAYTDDHIPSNYTFVDIASEVTNYDSEMVVSCSWQHISNAMNGVAPGTKFNHMFLAYKDKDGIFWPITSLLFKNPQGELFEYEHSETKTLYATYHITLNLVNRTFNTTDYKAIGFNQLQSDTVGVYLRDTKEPLAYYENEPNVNEAAPAMLKGGVGELQEDGTFKQKFQLVVKAYQYSGTIAMKIGFAIWNFTPTNNRANATYEIELLVKQQPIESLDATAATGIVILARPNAYYTEDFRWVKISAAPYQWVELYYNNLFISAHYVGPSGYIHRSSYVKNGYDTNGNAVKLESYIMSSGNRIKVITRTAKNLVETMLNTPDLQQDDLIAIWWINPTTLRAVSRINDVISIQWVDNIYKDGRDSRGGYNVESGNKGTCTTLYDEENDYFSCDIELVGYDPQKHPFLAYKVTDAAGNVFDGTYANGISYINNYMPGMTYEKALAARKGNISQGGTTPYEYNQEVNEYHYSFRVMSAEIK